TRLSPERHTNTDLGRPLSYDMGDDAVQPNGRQQQANGAEGAHEHGYKTTNAERFIDAVFNRSDVIDRRSAVGCANSFPNQSAARRGGPNECRRLREVGVLDERIVDDGSRIVI